MSRHLGIYLSLLLMANSLLAAESLPKSMAVTMNPLQALFLTYSFKLHTQVAKNMTLSVPLQFTLVPSSLGESFFTNSKTSYWWVESGAGLRFYLQGKALESSFYIEPELKVGYSQFELNTSQGARYLSLTPGVMGGYAWVLPNGFTANLGIGISHNFKIASWSAEGQETPRKFSYPWPIFDASIGYAW